MGGPNLLVLHAGVCPKQAGAQVALTPWLPMQMGKCTPISPCALSPKQAGTPVA